MSAKRLSKRAIARLRAVARQIVAEPQLYQQDSQARPHSARTGCGTAGCILGWAIALFAPRTRNRCARWERAAELLGLTEEQALNLWHVSRWPEMFREAHQNAGMLPQADSRVVRACIAVARIEHFIATNGRE